MGHRLPIRLIRAYNEPKYGTISLEYKNKNGDGVSLWITASSWKKQYSKKYKEHRTFRKDNKYYGRGSLGVKK